MGFCAEAQKVLQDIEQKERFCVDVTHYLDDSDVFESDEAMISEFGRVLSDEERYAACYFTVYNEDGIVGEVGIGYTDHIQCKQDGLEALEEALVLRARELGRWETAWDRDGFSKQQKSAIDMFMELPQQLAEMQTGSQPVWSVIGSKNLSIVSETGEPTGYVETTAILLEVIPEAAARLAGISRTRSMEHANTGEGQEHAPFYDRSYSPSDLGVRVRFLSDCDLKETEIGIDAERAESLKKSPQVACNNVELALDFSGTISITGEEPYYIHISAILDAEMLEQMASWEPEENSGSSPSLG